MSALAEGRLIGDDPPHGQTPAESRRASPGFEAGCTSTITVMWNSGFSVGDRVRRVMDGAIGVVAEIGPMGSIDVRWDSNGTVSVVVPTLLRRV